MKKIVSLFVAMMLSVAMFAETLGTERFDNRPTGDLNVGDISGFLKDGNWYNSLGNTFIQVADQQLSYAGYCEETSGKCAQFSANHGKDYRSIDKTATSGKVYMAFLLKVNALKTTSGAKGNSNLIAALWTDLNSTAAGALYNQVKIMTVDDNHFQLGIAKRTETAQFAETQLETGKTYLVVSEYIYKDDVDSVYLYINPSKDSKIPAVAAKISLASAQTDAIGFYGMALASNGNTPSDMLIDEIRVANFWNNLFGEGGDAPTPQDEPEIQADEEFLIAEEDGHTYSNKEYTRTLSVTGAHLNADIKISHSNEAIQLSTTELPKTGGSYTVTLHHPEKSGAQCDTVTFISGVTVAKTLIRWDNILVKPAEGTELLQNGSFEEYSVTTNPLFGELAEFDAWSWSASGTKVNSEDKVDGLVAMQVIPTLANGTLDQQVMVGEEYAAGDIFKLCVNWKAIDLQGGTLKLDCYWEPAPGGDAEKMKTHDADKLQVVLTDQASSEWTETIVKSYKPVGARYFRVRLIVSAKNTNVLFDKFSLIQKGHTDPENPEIPEDPDPETPEEGEWAHAFVWDESAPLSLLIEDFEEVSHNQPLALEGWQNVAPADARPWWGFDEAKTTPARGEGKYAKATAYQFDKESTDEWEMWLVTPALDYKNAASKLFAFSVMGEYLADEGNQAVFEIYYVDPQQPEEQRFQNLTEAFELPSVSDDNLVWRTFHLDLAPFAATMADVFHMAFRYAGPNGNEGAVTYYIDDVSWGRTDLQGVENIQSSEVRSQKVLRDGQLIILRGEKRYTILGSEL